MVRLNAFVYAYILETKVLLILIKKLGKNLRSGPYSSLRNNLLR